MTEKTLTNLYINDFMIKDIIKYDIIHFIKNLLYNIRTGSEVFLHHYTIINLQHSMNSTLLLGIDFTVLKQKDTLSKIFPYLFYQPLVFEVFQLIS